MAVDEEMEQARVHCCYQLSVEQFKNLRVQIDDNIKDTRHLELFTVAGLAAYYGWLFTQCLPSVPLLHFAGATLQSNVAAWLIPIAIAFLGAWRVWTNVKGILRVADYIALIEEEFATPRYRIGPDKGWENHLREIRAKEANHPSWVKMSRWQQIRYIGMGSFYWQFWLAMLLFTSALFVVSLFISESLNQICESRLGSPR